MEEKPIVDYIGKSALLEQTAEECSELSQASLKLARKLRNENPTPKSMDDILENLYEEIADVMLCIDALIDAGLISHEAIESVQLSKELRWYKRLKENEGEK